MVEVAKGEFVGKVTALCFITSQILLVGHGPYLKAFHVPTGQLVARELALPHTVIHRITQVDVLCQKEGVFDTFSIIVSGGKNICVVLVRVGDMSRDPTSNVDLVMQTEVVTFSDWIQDVTWLYDRSDPSRTEIVIAFAHNFVEVYPMQHLQERKMLRHVQCEVKCILYSARFYGHTWGDLLLASGTVFNEVHLWRPSRCNSSDLGIVHAKLIGHEGVIFGIRWFDDATLLASVSDDRSIRVWKVTQQEGDETPIDCAIIWGHTSRVWDCQFVDSWLVSISEDATCRVWQNRLLTTTAPGEQSITRCLAAWEGHATKNIWSLAVDPTRRIVATGGQDSGLRLWSLASIAQNNVDSESSLIHSRFPSKTVYAVAEDKSEDTDEPRNFVNSDYRTIVVATAEGYVLANDVIDGSWKRLHFDPAFSNYSIVSRSECGRIIAVASLQGEVLLLSPREEFEARKFSMHSKQARAIIITNGTDDKFFLLSYAVDSSCSFHTLDTRHRKIELIRTINIRLPKQKVNIMCAALSGDNRILVMGTRESALLVYQLLDSHSSRSPGDETEVSPSAEIKKAHQGDAITSVMLHGSGSTDLVLYSTGRDGAYNKYRVCLKSVVNTKHSDACKLQQSPLSNLRNEDSWYSPAGSLIESDSDTDVSATLNGAVTAQGVELQKLFREKVTKGWLERATFKDGELLLLGFYRKRGYLYNTEKRFEMLTVACGGAHRAWDFMVSDAQMSQTIFTFIRHQQLYTYVRQAIAGSEGFIESKLQEGFHGREVRSVQQLQLASPTGQIHDVLVTGAEDTLLKFHLRHHSKFGTSLKCITAVQKHSSVIRCVSTTPENQELLFTSGGNEEIRCWRLTVDHNASNPEEIQVHAVETGICPRVVDMEARIMDTTVYTPKVSRGFHILAAAYSDGIIRLWLYSEATCAFSLLAEGAFHDKCVLQISHCILQSMEGMPPTVHILSGATDGRIAIWDISSILQRWCGGHIATKQQASTIPLAIMDSPTVVLQHHQSGVNAMDVRYDASTKKAIIASGGDDNAISVSTLCWDASEIKFREIDTVGYAAAHASSIQSVYIGKNGAIVSLGTDQRFIIWRHLDNILCPQNVTFIDVPDPSAMDVRDVGTQWTVCIVGLGLQSLHVFFEH
ncbi:hypothetical protein BZG36_04844 [Bifiguratus adelaidae]|uniref:Uncharacterized protein n=1 Tax=Bifiguratus adelaidae TaxID=1938954 RepID=A0A261XVV3_9FUNG|nr:hypothetical protein BZG36_04844 [Bifiguratus adelaidae]